MRVFGLQPRPPACESGVGVVDITLCVVIYTAFLVRILTDSLRTLRDVLYLYK